MDCCQRLFRSYFHKVLVQSVLMWTVKQTKRLAHRAVMICDRRKLTNSAFSVYALLSVWKNKQLLPYLFCNLQYFLLVLLQAPNSAVRSIPLSIRSYSLLGCLWQTSVKIPCGLYFNRWQRQMLFVCNQHITSSWNKVVCKNKGEFQNVVVFRFILLLFCYLVC